MEEFFGKKIWADAHFGDIDGVRHRTEQRARISVQALHRSSSASFTVAVGHGAVDLALWNHSNVRFSGTHRLENAHSVLIFSTSLHDDQFCQVSDC